MNKPYDVKYVSDMTDGILKDVYLQKGYKYRVIRWRKNDVENIAYYKTRYGAIKRAKKENVAA